MGIIRTSSNSFKAVFITEEETFEFVYLGDVLFILLGAIRAKYLSPKGTNLTLPYGKGFILAKKKGI